ncbi:hypothetical protein [uncultured Boseongicola sp.]|jgi:hypothetical protein|uniref:hypothetical protein n=1 Tax=uncultured Boseongicola sp. TaxID=1648499 RepID=UPI00260C6F34|nr:hypothetical protein [uncultured Boseongicola sp.]
MAYFGLLDAVSRIAAILPNDLAPTNMNGPQETFTPRHDAAVRPAIADFRSNREIE